MATNYIVQPTNAILEFYEDEATVAAQSGKLISGKIRFRAFLKRFLN